MSAKQDPAKPEFSTSDAAAILDMSEPSLMNLIDAGRIEFRKVDNHHRIPASAIQVFHDRQREEGQAALTAIAGLSNRVGQVDRAGQPCSGRQDAKRCLTVAAPLRRQ